MESTWSYEQTQPQLPCPVYEEQPRWIGAYWKAWELAFRNFHQPAPGSRFVSPFIDAAFNENVFLWDTCFMTMFCDVAYPLVPGISSLDNFYATQYPDGEIAREIDRATGETFKPWRNTEEAPLFSRWGWNVPWRMRRASVRYRDREVPRPNPQLTLDALNHPLLCWSELEHYRWTGDAARLSTVWGPLSRYYQALKKYLLQGNGLYVTDWASMDNSPRNRHLRGGGTGVDISCEMVLFARQLAQAARILGRGEEAEPLEREAQNLADRINERMWNEESGFYFDLTQKGRQVPIKTVAAYWTLLSGVASPRQAQSLVSHLRNPSTFGRLNPVPSCSADARGYDSAGGYWRGATWAPIITMVIRGLERYGQGELAREIALKHVELVAGVLEQTGTIWENYAPDAAQPGRLPFGRTVRKDFVGWSGIGPILYLLEYAVGLRADAAQGRLEWSLRSGARCGCQRFRFGGRVVSLVAEAGERPAGSTAGRALRVDSDGPFTLAVRDAGRERSFEIAAGSRAIEL